ncbi:hypothetical protein MIMGU_mgv1a017203mg [Erythranthe guttata]|uniref:Uncharacterized protein n=1 Tax=Erythranthe guttata TaxID=4155 RepID=A0A022REN3_ERYGU|nr:hypothetical protein MIMGU_mgv1a017203mg [Erythranthe guttata]
MEIQVQLRSRSLTETPKRQFFFPFPRMPRYKYSRSVIYSLIATCTKDIWIRKVEEKGFAVIYFSRVGDLFYWYWWFQLWFFDLYVLVV